MSRLPSAYQKVEYLQGSGVTASPTGPYINTSYKAVSENYKIKSKFTVVNLVHNTVLFGGGSSTDIISVLMTSESQLKFYAGSGSVSEILTSFAVGTEYEMECTANNGNLTVTLNGTSRSGAYSGAINKDYPLFIFANNSSGSAGQYSSLKVYWFQIYDNGILVRDFVPCYRKSDNTAGLYDTVNGEFYTNAGTGTFAIGPEISEPVVVTGGLMPLSFALRRRLLQKAAGEKLCTVTVTGSFKGNYGNECVVRIGGETGEDISAVGSYSLPQGTILFLRATRGNHASLSTPTITLDGVTVSTVSSGIATYNLVVTQDCTIACSVSGTMYQANANIAVTT